MKENSAVRYSSLGQTLHWAMAVLILITFIYGPGGSEKHIYSAAREFDRQLHETLGLLIIVLTLLRVGWRAAATPPSEPPSIPHWMTITSKAVQLVVYILFFALPLTSITGAWLEGHPLTLLGNIQIAPLLAKSHETGKTIAEIHSWLGDAILWLAGLHTVAALYHHFILKDSVRASMLPHKIFLSRHGAGKQ